MKALRLAALLALGVCGAGQAQPATPVRVTVDEGTSMAVAVSPDGKIAGDGPARQHLGAARRRRRSPYAITDLFNDARQPVWTPDGKSIVFFAYRDGGYHLWSVSPDGSGQRQLTRGMFDEREPAFSHDGTRIAFSSDRGNPLGSDYNIFVLDLRDGEIRQLTMIRRKTVCRAGRRMTARSPSPPPATMAMASGRWMRPAGRSGAWRKPPSRIDAAAWAPGGEIIAHGVDGIRMAGWK